MGKSNILLGTTNPAKEGRLRWLLEGLPLEPVLPKALGLDSKEVPEEGASHEEIARLKAQGWSCLTGMLAISSDGGLVIPALGPRWDSLLTHRHAGEGVDDADRVAHLLRLMRPYTGEERGASWVEAVAVAEKGRALAAWQVRGPAGYLLEEPDPAPMVPGFWAFSLWYFPHLGKTYNRLDPQELKEVGDHWIQLKPPVQRFFQRGMP